MLIKIVFVVAAKHIENGYEGSEDYQYDVKELFQIKDCSLDQFNEISCLTEEAHPIEHLDPQ